jgi:hypothetical protein
MHAHDRTMLSSLGFADRDKQNPKHDLACQYLALPNNAERLGKVAFPSTSAPLNVPPDAGGGGYPKFRDPAVKGTVTKWTGQMRGVRFEQPITKGSGQYKATIGFEDLVIDMEPLYRNTELTQQTERDGPWEPIGDEEGVSRGAWFVHVEVKVAQVGAGDVIRQLNLYREYLHSEPCVRHAFVLATCYDLPATDVAQLKNERIKHVRLGAGFDRFCAERERSSEASSDTEVI